MKYVALFAASTVVWVGMGIIFFGTASIVTGVSSGANSLFGSLFGLWLVGCIIGGAATVYSVYDIFSGW